jgi:hypothetical protein
MANLSTVTGTGAHVAITLGLVGYLQTGQPSALFQAGAGILILLTILHFLYVSTRGPTDTTTGARQQGGVMPLEDQPLRVASIESIRRPLLLASTVWLAFFLPGVYVPSSEHLTAIQRAWNQGATLSLEVLWHGIVYATCYTFPNVAVLCCATTAMGCCLRSGTCSTRSALKLGIGVYAAALSGLFLVGDEPWKVGASLNYVRLATGMSVLGFVRGFKATWFA